MALALVTLTCLLILLPLIDFNFAGNQAVFSFISLSFLAAGATIALSYNGAAIAYGATATTTATGTDFGAQPISAKNYITNQVSSALSLLVSVREF